MGVCAALAGCGARSALVGPDERAETDGTSAVPCPPADNTPSSQRFGDGHQQVGTSIDVDAFGYPVLAGAFGGALDFGFEKLEAPAADPDAEPFEPLYLPLTGSFFVARLAPPECGRFALAMTPMARSARAIRVAVDDEGAVLVAASYFGSVDFGGGLLGAGGVSANAAIVKYGADGEHLWSREILAPYAIEVVQPAIDAQGNVLVAGMFSGELVIDGAAVSTSDTGPIDAFVTKLDKNGTFVWTKVLRLLSDHNHTTLSLAAWPDGQVAVSGTVRNNVAPIDLGGGPLGPPDQKGFVTSFDADGQHLWAMLTSPLVRDSAVTSTGVLRVLGGGNGQGLPIRGFEKDGASAGHFTFETPAVRQASFKPGPGEDVLVTATESLDAPDSLAIVVSRLAPSGGVVWTRAFPTKGKVVVAPAAGPGGVPFLGGAVIGNIDFGTGELPAQSGQADVFRATLAP